MTTRMGRVGLGLAVSVGATLAGAPTVLAQIPEEWCSRDRAFEGPRYCEVREFRLPSDPGRLVVEPRPHGDTEVQGWARDEVRVVARVRGHGATVAEASDAVARVRITIRDGRIVAQTPPGRRGWAVDYLVFVPHDHNLDLGSINGRISVTRVRGRVALKTINGGLLVRDVSGVLSAKTTNGDVTVRSTGAAWEGAGVEVQTTNGDIRILLFEGSDADLSLRMVHGTFSTNLPVELRGRTSREMSARLGAGGAHIRLATTNGDIRLDRAPGGRPRSRRPTVTDVDARRSLDRSRLPRRASGELRWRGASRGMPSGVGS